MEVEQRATIEREVAAIVISVASLLTLPAKVAIGHAAKLNLTKRGRA